MCGIAGIVRFDRPGIESRASLLAMRAALRHRGPDGEGEAFGSHCALGHTRLAMLDAEGGAQPLASADGRYLLVYNGELYNDLELRAELGGPWRSRSDAETVLAAWQRWGQACLSRLDGMFAFFVWDDIEQRGFGARDRLGVKPFAYTTDGGFAFASEAKALLRIRTGSPRAHLPSIVEYLVAPAFSGVATSPFEGIHYLQPGHLVRVDRGGVACEPWWQWSPTADEGDADALVGPLRAATEQAVRSCLRADVPLGVFSSGGLDSALVAAVARAELASLPAYTLTFEGQERWGSYGSTLVVSNDTPYAREVASELGLLAREVPFSHADLSSELRALSGVDDALPAWEQELSQRALARAAAREVKGVLVGDASDELHFGYHFLLDPGSIERPAAIVRNLGMVPVRPEVESAPLERLEAGYREVTGVEGGSWREGVLGTTQLIVRRWLPRLLHNGDIHCMAFGLEARVPFAALPMLDLAARVDPRVGMRDGTEKWLLREAARGLVPESIRTRRKSALPKDQDAGPVYQSELRRVLEAPHPLVTAVVDLHPVLPLLAAPRLTEPERAQLFRIVCLHHWATGYEVAAP